MKNSTLNFLLNKNYYFFFEIIKKDKRRKWLLMGIELKNIKNYENYIFSKFLVIFSNGIQFLVNLLKIY